jgi:creatinine amidohydrolase
MMETMTWPEVPQAVDEAYVPVLVVGSTEQHGPHLPLGTDLILPLELVKLAARELRLLIPPPLSYGFKSKALSGGGQSFPGTTSLDGETLIRLVRDVVSEVARHGFRQIVVVNWHMESVNLIWEGLDQARVSGKLDGVTVMSIDRPLAAYRQEELAWLFEDGFAGWDIEHAAIVETSLMLALRPDLVREELILDDAAAEHPWYDLIPEPPRHIPPSGVLSTATAGNRAKGDRLKKMIVAKLVEAITKEFATPRHESPQVTGSELRL